MYDGQNADTIVSDRGLSRFVFRPNTLTLMAVGMRIDSFGMFSFFQYASGMEVLSAVVGCALHETQD